MSAANKGVICSARFSPRGIASTASNPSLSPDKVIRGIIGGFLFSNGRATTGKEIARSYSDVIWPENAICKHDNELELQKSLKTSHFIMDLQQLA
jgi:hypothetical protein